MTIFNFPIPYKEFLLISSGAKKQFHLPFNLWNKCLIKILRTFRIKSITFHTKENGRNICLNARINGSLLIHTSPKFNNGSKARYFTIFLRRISKRQYI